jgi:hypothetical protein
MLTTSAGEADRRNLRIELPKSTARKSVELEQRDEENEMHRYAFESPLPDRHLSTCSSVAEDTDLSHDFLGQVEQPNNENSEWYPADISYVNFCHEPAGCHSVGRSVAGSEGSFPFYSGQISNDFVAQWEATYFGRSFPTYCYCDAYYVYALNEGNTTDNFVSDDSSRGQADWSECLAVFVLDNDGMLNCCPDQSSSAPVLARANENHLVTRAKRPRLDQASWNRSQRQKSN